MADNQGTTTAAATTGPYDHLSDEEKQAIVRGRCNYLALMIFSTVAFVQGGTTAGYCDFAERNVQFSPGSNLTSTCATLNLTSWNEQVCKTFFTKHGVGFYGWYGTVPVDKQVCTSYDQFIPNRGYVVPDFDSAFNAARVFAIMANIFGAFAWFTIIFSSCCPIDNQRLKGLSVYFTLAYICQAFTFLMFASNVCGMGFFIQYYPDLETDGAVEDVTCS